MSRCLRFSVAYVAALSACNRAETEPSRAYRINALGARNLALARALPDSTIRVVIR